MSTYHRGLQEPALTKRRIAASVAVALAAASAAGGALALEFDTGNPDLTIRWDNTVRFNYGGARRERDDKIGNRRVSDEGTYSFDSGDAVASRFDLLSELDVVFRKRHGLRLSAAGWYDAAYDGTSHSNPTRRWQHPELRRQSIQ